MISESTVLSGHLRLDSRIAQGGMGDVYIATDLRDPEERDDERVVVKVLRATSPDDVRRFESEATALRRLDHPAIVRLFGTGEHDGTPYLVMELIDGPSLKQRMREGTLDGARVADIGHHVAEALAHAHSLGVVHRDIKPANVLLAEDGHGQAHVADFGIARLADVTGMTATGMTMGTAAYLAPEQLTSGEVGPPADVYSLGLVLLEVLTGRQAFEGTTTEAALARLHSDPAVPPDLATGWRILLRRMTSRRVDDRPPMEVVAELLADGDPDAAAVSQTEETVELSTTEVHEAASAGAGDVAGDAAPSAGGRRRLVRAGGVLATVLVVGVAGLSILDLGGDEPADEPSPAPVEEQVDVPEELEDALERLRGEVSR